MMEVVAHRGAHEHWPENSLAAFERAAAMGADAIEMDVRLTRDHVPVISHLYTLPEWLGLPGCVFDYTLGKLTEARQVRLSVDPANRLPTLRDALDSLVGRIGLEIEIKGPEPECVDIIAEMLSDYRRHWEQVELTSYDPTLLLAMQERCPGLPTDLLYPRPEPWRTLDIVAHEARHLGRLSRARAVHLHPDQLSKQVVSALAASGLRTHIWGANDMSSLHLALELGISRVCTDQLAMALDWRTRASA